MLVAPVLTAWLLAAAAAPAGAVDARLDNGLEVTIVPDPESPVVSTRLWYHVGAADERPGELGLAHLFEHLMFGPTLRHGKEDYARLHHRFGGYDNAYMTPDETVYVSDLPPEGSAEVVSLEADRLTGLVVDEANLANEKRIVTEELRLRTENDPVSRLLVAAQKALLGTHPYAHDPSGTKEEIAAATVASALSFRERWYTAANAHLVVVGPVDAAATMREVSAAFGGARGRAPERDEIPDLTRWSYPASVDLREDLPPVEVALLAVPLPPASSPEALAIDALEEILTGGEVDPVRESLVTRKRKALDAGVRTVRLRRGGALILYAASLPYRRKSTAFELLESERATLGRLLWLTPERFEAARRSLLRRELERAYDSGERADAIGRALWWEGDVGRAFDRAARIRALDREDVRRAFLRYVAAAEPVRIWVRPERIPLRVRLFGWLYPLVSR